MNVIVRAIVAGLMIAVAHGSMVCAAESRKKHEDMVVDGEGVVASSESSCTVASQNTQNRMQAALSWFKKNMVTHYKTVAIGLGSIAGIGYWWRTKMSSAGISRDTNKGNAGNSTSNTDKLQTQKLYDAFYKDDKPAMKAALKAGANPRLKLNPREAERMGVVATVYEMHIAGETFEFSRDTTLLGGLLHKLWQSKNAVSSEEDDNVKEYKELIQLLIDTDGQNTFAYGLTFERSVDGLTVVSSDMHRQWDSLDSLL